MSSTDTAKQCVDLTLHAQELGVDICYILTPYFECSGKPGVLEYLRYVADRTDMPLGFFNSHSTGLVLTPQRMCRAVIMGSRAGAASRTGSGRAAQPGGFTISRLKWCLEANDRSRIRLEFPIPGRSDPPCTSTEKPGLRLFSQCAPFWSRATSNVPKKSARRDRAGRT